MTQPPPKDGGYISDSGDEADTALNQSGSDNNDCGQESDSGPPDALAKPGPLTIKTQNIGSPNCAGRLGRRRCRRHPSAARMPIYAMSSRSALASGSRKFVAKSNKDHVMTPPRMSKAAKSRALKKSPSPISSPSACSSGFSWSPLSTSTLQPVQFQPRSSAAVNPPAPSTPVRRLAPQSEFLSLIASPSGLTHDEAYQQARILAARRLDLEIELQQTEELLGRMTKKAGKGKAKED
ncbi:hypothetical protein BJ165DRAFT_1532445 [Panaeolus papilionaceus]|nr:hypothetical protein BJ165DRAFT_1532445 [Panaeolus papilionaceus]